MRTFHDELTILLAVKNLTLPSMAKEIGIGHVTLYRLMTYKHRPNMNTLAKIGRYLYVNKDLLNDDSISEWKDLVKDRRGRG